MKLNARVLLFGGIALLLVLQACAAEPIKQAAPSPAPATEPATEPATASATASASPSPSTDPTAMVASEQPAVPGATDQTSSHPAATLPPEPTPRGGGVEVDFYDIDLNDTDAENFDKRMEEIIAGPVSLDSDVGRSVLIDAYKQLARYKPTGGAWKSIGPGPILGVNMPQGPINSGGKTNGFAIDPRNTNVVYAAASYGGIWKTEDGGKTWRSLTDRQVPMVYGEIVMDPHNPDVLYGLLGEFYPSLARQYGYLANGIMRTRDGGKTWKLIGADVFMGAAVSALDFDSQGNLYAASGLGAPLKTPPDRPDFGIFKSSDGGDTWQRLYSCGDHCVAPPKADYQDIAGGFMDLDVGPDDAIYSTLCYWFCQGSSIVRSRDGGKTWTTLDYTNVVDDWQQENKKKIALGDDTQMPYLSGFELAVSRTDPKLVLAGGGIHFQIPPPKNTKDKPNKPWSFVMRSRDGGDTWEWLPDAGDYCTGTAGNDQCMYDNIVQIDPTDENILYIGGSFSRLNNRGWDAIIKRSGDGGDTWDNMNPIINKASWMHPDSHGLAIDPKDHNVVWVGTDGGIYRTKDATKTRPVWEHLSKGINTMLFVGVGLHPTDPNYLIGGLQDNGVAYTTDPAQGWQGASQGDAGYSAVDPFQPDTVYSEWPQGFFARNEERGQGKADDTWYPYTDGLDMQKDEWLFYAPFVLDPKNEGVIYFASNRVYKTTDRGDNWEPVSDYLTTAPKQSIQALAISNSDPEVVYAGTTDSKLFVTTNAGKTWKEVTGRNFPPRRVNRIAVDPANPKEAYAVFSGFDAQTPGKPGHIFRTRDGGKTWEDISLNLPDAPLGAVVIDTRPKYAGVYIGGAIGMWVLRDGAKQWLPYGTGMPYALITDIQLNTRTGIMAVATYGRSVWVIQMP